MSREYLLDGPEFEQVFLENALGAFIDAFKACEGEAIRERDKSGDDKSKPIRIDADAIAGRLAVETEKRFAQLVGSFDAAKLNHLMSTLVQSYEDLNDGHLDGVIRFILARDQTLDPASARRKLRLDQATYFINDVYAKFTLQLGGIFPVHLRPLAGLHQALFSHRQTLSAFNHRLIGFEQQRLMLTNRAGDIDRAMLKLVAEIADNSPTRKAQFKAKIAGTEPDVVASKAQAARQIKLSDLAEDAQKQLKAVKQKLSDERKKITAVKSEISTLEEGISHQATAIAGETRDQQVKRFLDSIYARARPPRDRAMAFHEHDERFDFLGLDSEMRP
ncbi:MAG: hypothetical protein P1U34_02925 [Coxiellaceae bacterium]|nr:hypothetical protein [Coxiellaceae bacterium]